MKKCIAGIVPLLFTVSAIKIPSYIQTCSRNDPKLDECVVRIGSAAIPHFIYGDPKIGLPNMDPLEIQEISLKQGTKQVGMNLVISDCKMYGLAGSKFLRSRVDLKKRHIEWDFSSEKGVQVLGHYKASGQVLFLPITGSGKANITIVDIHNSIKFDYDLVKKKNGKEYVNITKVAFPNQYNRVYLRLDNLFNGDKLLGENMNQFLNENWKEVFQDLAPGFEATMGEVFKRLLSNIMSHIPYDQLFPNTTPKPT